MEKLFSIIIYSYKSLIDFEERTTLVSPHLANIHSFLITVKPVDYP